MPAVLAITALDVAFVSAIAAIVGALCSPLAAWLIAKAARTNERVLALSGRNYATRKDAYGRAATYASRHLAVLQQGIENMESENALPIDQDLEPPLTDYFDFYGTLRVVGSDAVQTAYEGYQHAHGEAFGLATEAWAQHRAGTLSDETLTELKAKRVALRAAAKRFVDAARDDLQDADAG